MHEPTTYTCPFCALISGEYPDRQTEIVFETKDVLVFPAKHHKPGNEGNLLVVTRRHIENLYDLPTDLAQPLQHAIKLAATALKEVLGCDGITIRQNNEPAGGQDVWHYHVHIIPRYIGDKLHSVSPVVAPIESRIRLAQTLKRVMT
ncbi:MAG: histidine triad (HIT) family protein [Candidatus Azotimanducaceae bacterium]|jgi:histidine triad (HIT) family protein